MTDSQVDRVAVRVEDLEAAVRDFAEIFGMEFEITDVPEFGIRVAICDQGIELVQVMDAKSRIVTNYAGGVLAALSVKVQDIESVKQKLLQRGVELINEADALDFKEFYCVSATFHGLPLTVSRYGDSFLEALHGAGEMPPDYQPRVHWYKKEFAPPSSQE